MARIAARGKAARGAARRLALGLMVALTTAGTALAQAGSPTCQQLEGSLMALDRSAGGVANQQAQAAKLRGDLDRLSAQARGMGCDAPRGFLIFQGPPRPPQCDQIDDQVSRLRSQIAGLERGGTDNGGQRRALIIALAQNNCGPQYTAAVQAARRAAEPAKPKNFFEAIFGTQQPQSEETSPDLDLMPLETPKTYSSRTVCVRTCDGYFFPMASATNSSRYAQDEQLCKRLCPGSDAQLFTYSGDIKSAVSISGQSYMSLPNALRYRKELVPSCTCKPAGQSWAQALAGLEDETTLRKGDILVTEEQAREMSAPRPAEPTKGGKAAAKPPAGSTAAAEAAAGGPVAATVAAPLAPASEQPGQRKVRIIPLPRSQNAQNQQGAAAAGQGTAQ
ncbi:DUF2865 domain-containing protein [Xanthobacter sp. 126]|uniref:DUF2865 domain-containing protein n=1 Tax=Xanthobacter sp. 126 TaxID=1131814 RepID=UPI0004B68B53|nr:DUF2865 domain-containing protein [Xanthobacter sp. 126]